MKQVDIAIQKFDDLWKYWYIKPKTVSLIFLIAALFIPIFNLAYVVLGSVAIMLCLYLYGSCCVGYFRNKFYIAGKNFDIITYNGITLIEDIDPFDYRKQIEEQKEKLKVIYEERNKKCFYVLKNLLEWSPRKRCLKCGLIATLTTVCVNKLQTIMNHSSTVLMNGILLNYLLITVKLLK